MKDPFIPGWAMIMLALGCILLGHAAGSAETENAVIRDCSKLGKTIIQDTVYTCSPQQHEGKP